MPTNDGQCIKACFPIGKAEINKTFIVGCKIDKFCPDGRRTSNPGTYKLYRDKFRTHGLTV